MYGDSEKIGRNRWKKIRLARHELFVLTISTSISAKCTITLRAPRNFPLINLPFHPEKEQQAKCALNCVFGVGFPPASEKCFKQIRSLWFSGRGTFSNFVFV